MFKVQLEAAAVMPKNSSYALILPDNLNKRAITNLIQSLPDALHELFSGHDKFLCSQKINN